MRHFMLALIIATALGTAPARAEILSAQQQAVLGQRAQAYVVQLARSGRIAGAWVGAEQRAVLQSEFEGEPVWMVTFYDKKGALNRKFLYIYLDPNGQFLGMSYTAQ